MANEIGGSTVVDQMLNSGNTDTNVSDTPEVEESHVEVDEEVETGSESTDEGGDSSTDASGEGDSNSDESTSNRDGRAMPAELKSHLKQLQESNPKLAASIRSAFYTMKEFEQAGFKNAKEVIQLKQTLDQVSFKDFSGTEFKGADAIRTMQETVDLYGTADEAIFSGNGSEVLQKIFEQEGGKEAISSMGPSMVQLWAQADPEAFNKEFSGYIYSVFATRGGVIDHLERAIDELSRGDVQRAQKYLDGIKGHFNGLQETSTKEIAKKASNQPDPQIKEMQDKLAQMEKEKSETWNNTAKTECTNLEDEILTSNINALLKGKKVDDYDMRYMKQRIEEEVLGIIGKDEAYKKQFNQAYQSGDINKLKTLFKSKWDKLTPEIARKIVGKQFRTINQTKQTPTNKQVENKVDNKGWSKVEKMPSTADIDYNHKDHFDNIMNNRAVLKNGKKVYWA